jgi:hypothetical protein
MFDSLGIKICAECKIAFSYLYQTVQCPHDYRDAIDEKSGQEIKKLFHKLWSKDVHSPGYKKGDWMELQRLLQARGIEV